jgi:hypothetical protein
MIFSKQAHKSSELASRMTALDEEIAASAAALADLKSRWRSTIVDGDDAARAVIEDAITTAERKAALQTERRDILIAEHEAALERDAREAFGRRHAAQAEKNSKVAAEAQKKLRRAWDLLSPALRDMAEARVETNLLNQAMPDGFAPLAYADDIARSTLPLPRKELSTETVTLWCYKSTGARVNDQSAVQGGVLQNGPYAPAQRCIERTFRRVLSHPAENARHAAPISTELRFPNWDGIGVMFDGAFVSPDSVANALSVIEANQGKKAIRPVLEEFIAIDDAASDAA